MSTLAKYKDMTAQEVLKLRGGSDSAFSNIKFSNKTANQEAMKIIEEIMSSANRAMQSQKNGTTIVFDRVTGRGFGISRRGLFNGFRNM